MEVFENYNNFVNSSKPFGIIKSTVLLNLHDFGGPLIVDHPFFTPGKDFTTL